MQRIYQCVVSFLLGAALIAPAGLWAKDKNQNCPDKGYYDRDHKDCHSWDDHEGRAYQTWAEAQHKTHREFSKLKASKSQFPLKGTHQRHSENRRTGRVRSS